MQIRPMVSCVLGLFGVALSANGGGCPLGFQHVVTGGGANVHVVTFAKLNVDNFPDLVIASTSQGIGVALNTGSGSFASPVFYGGTNGGTVAAGDIDGDLDTDLVFTNPGTLSFRLNNGNGVFGASTSIPYSGASSSLILADMDNDNDLDIVTCEETVVRVLTNNGQGVFSELPVGFPAAATIYPNAITAADFDGDGFIDIGTVGLGQVHILRNTGFAGVLYGEIAYSGGGNVLTAADVNGDNRPDLITASSVIFVMLNNGDGTFAEPVQYPHSGTALGVSAADFDGDGDVDLAVPSMQQDAVRVFPNNGDGTFATSQMFSVVDAPYGVATADFDLDGDVDIAAANSTSIVTSILKNTGALPTLTQQPIGQVLAAGATAQFSVSIAGGSGVTYQWQRGGVNLVNGPTIQGADTPNLTINPVSISHAGVYRVVVTNGCGSVNSAEVALTIIMTCPADSNGDGVVNIDDLVSLITTWGRCP